MICEHCQRYEPLGAGVFGARRALIADIQAVVAEYFGIPVLEMKSQRRARTVARPRQVAIYLARRITRHSLPEIGRRFDRDHTTVIHAIRTVEKLRADDPEIDRAVRTLEARIAT